MSTAQNSLRVLLQYFISIPYFFIWWYFYQTIFLIKFIWRTLLLLIDGISIVPVIRHLFSPYHLDKTLVGRLVGFVVRIMWSITGLIVIVVFFGALLCLFPLHLSWPFGFYFGMSLSSYFDLPLEKLISVLLGWMMTFSAVFFYIRYYIIQPKKTVSELKLSGKTSLFEIEKTFTLRLKKNWHKALQLASSDDKLEELSYFLFLSVVLDNRNRSIFHRLNLNPRGVYKKAKEQEYILKKSVIPLSDLFKEMMKEAKQLGHDHLDSDVLLVTLVKHNKAIHDFFVKLGISDEQIEQTSAWVYQRIKKQDGWKYWRDANFRLHGGYDRGWVAGWTPTLKHFTQNITQLVAKGQVPHIVGRKKEIQQIVQVLSRTTKNNVVLLGPPGVGKTSIVYGIAQQMLTGEVEEMKDKKVVSLDFPAMLADTGMRGGFESRFKKVLEESGPGKTILFIDELGMGASVGGGGGAMNAASILAPYLSTGNIQCIGAASFIDYKKHIETNSTLTNLFQTVEIKEPSDKQTISILENFCNLIEKKQKVTVSFQAIEAAVKLSKKYIRDRVLPEKAIDILDEAAVVTRKKEKRFVTAEIVAEIVAAKTGIPVAKLSEKERTKLLSLEKELHKRVIGQDEAIKAISNAMRRARVGLKDSRKPVASFLFLGPTGVGKTETCKALSDVYFGSEDNMIRMDMSEYQEASSISRFLGSAPGTKDFESGGQLTEAVKRNPFSLILLDELEKAHTRIFDIFLQVFDDGRLTDSSGRVVSFQDNIIIATSNAQSLLIQDAVKRGVSKDKLKDFVMDNLTKTFRPEFVNRFDAVVVFEPLDMEQVMQIVVLMLQKVREKLAKQEIGFEIAPEALVSISRQGFDPQFGARPLKRVIQEKIENKIADQLLKKEIKAGGVVKIEEKDVV